MKKNIYFLQFPFLVFLFYLSCGGGVLFFIAIVLSSDKDYLMQLFLDVCKLFSSVKVYCGRPLLNFCDTRYLIHRFRTRSWSFSIFQEEQ